MLSYIVNTCHIYELEPYMAAQHSLDPMIVFKYRLVSNIVTSAFSRWSLQSDTADEEVLNAEAFSKLAWAMHVHPATLARRCMQC